jgi:hypothetical protein
MPDQAPVKSNEKYFESIGDALVARSEWEKKLAKFEAQRYTQDRDEVNNDPFPNASNIRYPLADMIMGQKKAVYSQIVYSSESLANFKPLTPANIPFANNLAPYFSGIIKERTNWEEEKDFALDSGLQDGESYCKITYDVDEEVPVVKWVENLMMILPPNAGLFHDSPWACEIIHLSEDQARKRWGQLPGFEELLKGALSDEGYENQGDSAQRLQERYSRAGITTSCGNGSRFVVWEFHYEDADGNKRIRTLSPDKPSFDFQDDREYPYKNHKGKSRWMYEQFRREWTNPGQHSSRGIPEIVEEFEFLLSASWRFKHNVMSMTQTPVFQTESGLPPGSTNNISLTLGSCLPAGVTPVQWPAPAISFDEEMAKTRDIVERYVASPDTGIGRGNTLNARTAREVSLISSLQQMSVNYETTPWKKFVRNCYRQAWERIVQYKPKSLEFFINGTIQSLPPDSINGDYMIDVSWSGDNIDKEYLAQKAFSLWQAGLNNPVFNQVELAKNMLEYMVPGQVQRFLANPQLQQADMVERIANELDTMVSTGFPVRPKEDVDHYMAVVIAMQFLQSKDTKGQPVDSQSLNLINQYMAAHRDMLAKTNPQQRKQLDAELSQMQHAMDEKQRQAQLAQVAPVAQGQPQLQALPNPSPIASPPVNSIQLQPAQ